MTEREMEDLIAAHAEEFFPRKLLVLKGRQGTFSGIGRFDLLFEDQFKNNLLMELKAVPAKLDVAEQLVKYKQGLEDMGKKNVIMWLVAPVVPKHVADFLDRFGVEHTEIHEAEFRQIASRHSYIFASETSALSEPGPSAQPVREAVNPSDRVMRFHEAMIEIYERARTEAKYNAGYFRQMLTERGGLETARYLLHAPISGGFTELWNRKRLDLTVEAYVLKPEWKGLFTEEELKIAAKRLSDLEYFPS